MTQPGTSPKVWPEYDLEEREVVPGGWAACATFVFPDDPPGAKAAYVMIPLLGEDKCPLHTRICHAADDLRRHEQIQLLEAAYASSRDR